MSATLPIRLRDIVRPEDLDEMGRRRHQQPSVFKTKAKKRPMWYFRARVDAIKTKDGEKF
jgi:hypothetical protein